MGDSTETTAGASSIAALPPTTVRQIGSMQVLTDSSSVVKELIDNALDARANAIFVEISCNTVDSIQVKDTGHGIPQEDRPLLCRRYCTSKIRDFHDLKSIGGTWLGFRGEALASMATMSGSLEVTTRVEGESVASKMKYDGKGELSEKAEPASAPTGTTVKVIDFLKQLPVRKQTALNDSLKTLVKIRQLMQAYAVARPTVRFSLRVLKSKSNKNDFMYAPKKDGSVEDAVLKIFGKDCASECEWTVLESDGFEIRAFLPKTSATGSKIAIQGTFLSIDARPVSTARGTLKKIVAAFKERLRKSSPGLASIKDAFFCLNIICPPGSYDPNIEPAKNDVLFEDEDLVLAAVNKLLVSHYPEQIQGVNEERNIGSSIHLPEDLSADDTEHATQLQTPGHSHHDIASSLADSMSVSEGQAQWRSTMYGIDAEDLEFVHDDPISVIEEEEGRRDVSVSNPWVIAKMNAWNKQHPNHQQLITPTKDRDRMLHSSSPSTTALPPSPKILLTPQTPKNTSISSPPKAVGGLRPFYESPTHPLYALDNQSHITPAPLPISQRIQNDPNKIVRMNNFQEQDNERLPRSPRPNAHTKKFVPPKYKGSQKSKQKGDKRDIRDFFGPSEPHTRENAAPRRDWELPSFTPINGGSQELRNTRNVREDNRRFESSEVNQQSSLRIPFSQAGPTRIHRPQPSLNQPVSNSEEESRLRQESTPNRPGGFVDQDALSHLSSPQTLTKVPRSFDILGDLPGERAKVGSSRSAKPSGSALKHSDIEAQLNAYVERENRAMASRANPPVSPTRTRPANHAVQCGPINSVRRRQSSKKFTEAHSEHSISHVERRVKANLDRMMRCMQILDMSVEGGNTQQWGRKTTPTPHSGNPFSIPPSTAQTWVAILCKLLDQLYKREDGVSVETEIQVTFTKQLVKKAYPKALATESEVEDDLTKQLMATAADTHKSPRSAHIQHPPRANVLTAQPQFENRHARVEELCSPHASSNPDIHPDANSPAESSTAHNSTNTNAAVRSIDMLTSKHDDDDDDDEFGEVSVDDEMLYGI